MSKEVNLYHHVAYSNICGIGRANSWHMVPGSEAALHFGKPHLRAADHQGEKRRYTNHQNIGLGDSLNWFSLSCFLEWFLILEKYPKKNL
jgi:hypothetical protein